MAWNQPTKLTAAESARLYNALSSFYAALQADSSLEVPTGYRELLAVCLSCVDRGLVWGEAELVIVKWTLETLLDNLEEDEWDEHLERAYMRLFGVWRGTPWFTKKKGLSLPTDFPSLPPDEIDASSEFS